MDEREDPIADQRCVDEDEWHIGDTKSAPHPFAKSQTLGSSSVSIEADYDGNRVEDDRDGIECSGQSHGQERGGYKCV